MSSVQGVHTSNSFRPEIRAMLCLTLLLVVLLSFAILPQLAPDIAVDVVGDLTLAQSKLLWLIILATVIALLGTTAILLQARCRRIESAQTRDNHAALHDPLTGLSNRRHFESAMQSVLESQTPEHSLLMIDLDRFKPVNDLHGHAAGDALLQEVAQGLNKIAGSDALVARLGGDEFVVLANLAAREPLEKLAIEILNFVRLYRLNWQGQRLAVGASIGVTQIHRCNMTIGGVLAAADQALYQAKESGRGAAYIALVADTPDAQLTMQRIGSAGQTNPAPVTRIPLCSQTPELFGSMMLWTPPVLAPGQQPRKGSRQRREIAHWISVEPVHIDDPTEPAIRMRELFGNAASGDDGGAVLARYTLSKILSTATCITPVKLGRIGFSVPITAHAIVADEKLPEDLLRINALACHPLRHLTIVLHDVIDVYDSPRLKKFCQRLSLAGVKTAVDIRSNTLDALLPFWHLEPDEFHIGPELCANLQPGSSGEAVLRSAINVATTLNLTTVAYSFEAINQHEQLLGIGADRIVSTDLGDMAPLLQSLKQNFGT